MPVRSDYLRDLRENPGATAEEVQPRVQAPTLAAVETQFRKCASANLVACDESKPKRYTLTEKGAEELRKLEPQNASMIVKSNGGAVEITQPGERCLSRAKALLERVRALEGVSTRGGSTPDSGIEASESTQAASDLAALYLARHELHSFRWSDRLFGEDSRVKARVVDFEDKVGEEIADQVKRLVAAEREIHDDLWSDSRELLSHVLELREALHLPMNVFGLGKREADSSHRSEGAEG